MTGFPEEGTPERQFGCLYLEDQEDGTFNCLIYSGDFPGDDLDEKVKEYFDINCRNYPNPEEPGCVPPRHILYPGCTYRMVKREDLNAISN